MAHHPTSADEMQGAGFLVHPLLIGLSALIFAASVFLSRRLGHGRLAVVAANTAMAIWLAANTGAATINGLIVPALAARGADIGQDIFRLCWEANQALAAIGVFAAGFAYALWATVLLRGQPWIDRGLGVVALITGLLPMLALATGLMQMNIAGATVIYTAQSLWIVLAGIWLSHEPAH
jgi:drug/metabolite transporter (DMT)-like permease